MSRIPNPQEIYRHFKGDLYQIVAIAHHTETGEQLVVYQALYGDFRVYARPLSMFFDKVDKEKYPNAQSEYRFELHKTVIPPREAGKAMVESAEMKSNTAAEEGELETEKSLDPLLLEFIEADTYEQRLNILAGLHHRITDDMITTMAIVCDVEVNEGHLEERYDSLRSCLMTLEKYECNRVR